MRLRSLWGVLLVCSLAFGCAEDADFDADMESEDEAQDLETGEQALLFDSDGDGVLDLWDNCPNDFNRNQLDSDGDNHGNVCDCSPFNANIYPNAPEVCDGVDNDCDGVVDEWLKVYQYRDADGDGFGNPFRRAFACPGTPYYATRGGDCDDNNGNTYPGAAEVCDNIDNDCDGSIDEGLNCGW